MACGVWATHFKSTDAAAQPSGSSQPGRREEKAIAVRTSPEMVSRREYCCAIHRQLPISACKCEMAQNVNTSTDWTTDDGHDGSPVATALLSCEDCDGNCRLWLCPTVRASLVMMLMMLCVVILASTSAWRIDQQT